MKAAIKSILIIQILFLYSLSLFSFEKGVYQLNILSQEVEIGFGNVSENDAHSDGQHLYNFDTSSTIISKTYSSTKFIGISSFTSENYSSLIENKDYSIEPVPSLKSNQIDLNYSFHSFW